MQSKARVRQSELQHRDFCFTAFRIWNELMQTRTIAKLGALGSSLSDAVNGTRRDDRLVILLCGAKMSWCRNSNDQPDVVLGRYTLGQI